MELNGRRTAVIALVVLVALAGCTGAGTAGGGGDGAAAGDVKYRDGGAERAAATSTPMATPAAPEDEAAGGGSGGGAGGGAGGEVQLRDRQIIRTANVEVEVEDFDATKRRLASEAADQGGFVSDSSERLHRVDNETYKTGRVVLRVPRENFDEMMDRVNATGTVLSANVNSQDVTDQLVDIEARLENLRAERDRLRDLYQQAEDTEAVLKVDRRLSDVQGQIERLEARQQSLERRVALSTITVELREPRPEPDPLDPDRWYDTPILGAFLQSVDGVVVTVRALAVAFAYALPYLVVFGAPLVGGAVLIRRRRLRDGPIVDRPAGAADADTPDEPDDESGGEAGDGPADSDQGSTPIEESDDEESDDEESDEAEGAEGADDAHGAEEPDEAESQEDGSERDGR